MTDIVKVHFDFTARDMAEVAAREANRSNMLRTQRLRGKVMGVLIWGVIVFALTELSHWSIRDRAIVTGLICGLALLAKFIPRTSPVTERLINYYKEQLGGDGPFQCEVELGPTGLVTRQFGA